MSQASSDDTSAGFYRKPHADLYTMLLLVAFLALAVRDPARPAHHARVRVLVIAGLALSAAGLAALATLGVLAWRKRARTSPAREER